MMRLEFQARAPGSHMLQLPQEAEMLKLRPGFPVWVWVTRPGRNVDGAVGYETSTHSATATARRQIQFPQFMLLPQGQREIKYPWRVGELVSVAVGRRQIKPSQPQELALLAAVQRADEIAIQSLLAAGTNLNITWEEEVVEWMIPHSGRMGDSALICWPVHLGQLESARLLLDYDADPDATDANGHSALGLASLRGDVAMAALLLDHGADVNAMQSLHETDDWGFSPYHTCLHDAVKKGQTEVVRLLLQHGADVNSTNMLGKTPLAFAKSYNSPEMMELLLEAGAKE